MTKTIEFVERKIKDKKEQLKRLKNLKTISNKYELKINELLTKNTEEDIEYLEQIKCELEAWEIAKKKDVHINKIKEGNNVNSYNNYLVIQLTEEEFNKLKKALEVEWDEGNRI